MNPARPQDPNPFAHIRRAFLADTLVVDFTGLGLWCEFLLLGEATLLIAGRICWVGHLALDRFDPDLSPPAKGEPLGLALARHLLRGQPFCLSPGDLVKNPGFVQSLSTVLGGVIPRGESFQRIERGEYAPVSLAQLGSMDPGDFRVYCGCASGTAVDALPAHSVTIASRPQARHRLVAFRPLPVEDFAGSGSWPESGSFALAEWATDQLTAAHPNGVLSRAWRLACWESLHGTTREEQVFESVSGGHRFVLLPAEGGGLRVGNLTPNSVRQEGALLNLALGTDTSFRAGCPWHDAVFTARFASPAAAASARSLLFGGMEVRIDQLPDLPLSGCAYTYYIGSDHRQAGVTSRGMALPEKHYWDELFLERAPDLSPGLEGWTSTVWSKPVPLAED